jgi:ABC-type multidrug transport system ATPase subunit
MSVEMVTSAKVSATGGHDIESGSTAYDIVPVQDAFPITGHEPHDIAWSDVSFKVGEKSILTNCYGAVPAGSVCAIMGPSGAGKSSLLNVLAGRSGTKLFHRHFVFVNRGSLSDGVASAMGISVSGTVTVAGKKINPVQFRQQIAYVMQDDALMPTATVREALEFSASLRLPTGTSKDNIDTLVEATIKNLGLDSCADVMIGGALIKGISGGQRKRASVGVEIITNPALLFLDEPTSGLDSFSASNLVRLLKSIAAKNAAVLCTIHQPSSDVFFEFDLCIFMKEGRIFYQGPTANLTSFFGSFKYVCPANYNPSDYVMSLSQTVTMEELEKNGLMLKNDGTASELRKALVEMPVAHSKRELSEDNVLGAVVKASMWRQIVWLSWRELLNTKRDVAALAGRFGVTIVLNLLFGLIFLNAGGKNNADPNDFAGHFGAITMVTIASMFGAAQPVMLAFPFERPLFMREYSTGTYGAMSYFLSKLFLELPLTLVQTILQYILVYYMCDFKGNFMFEVLSAWGLGAASCSVAVMLGCTLNDVRDVTEMAPLLFVPQMLFAGFFIRTSQIPIFLRWAQYLCAIKYSLNIILITEFDASNPSCSGDSADACRGILEDNDIKPNDWWIYMIILFVLFAAFRIAGAMILVKKAQRFY